MGWTLLAHFSFEMGWTLLAHFSFEMGWTLLAHFSWFTAANISWFTMAIFRFAMGVMYHGHFSFRNGRDVPLFAICVVIGRIFFCAIIWIISSSWFWVQMNLQVNWNALFSINPRTKGRCSKVVSVQSSQFLLHRQPRRHPRHCLRLCFTCDAVTPTWQGTVWDPAPETELQWISCTAICI